MAVHAVSPNPWMILPFVFLLGTIAFCPLLTPEWWQKHYAKVAFGLGIVVFAYYFGVLGARTRLLEVAHDYVSFIVLIGALFIVSGGIHITIKGEATPLVNTGFLLIGAVAANILGTTGASMLLIRPWIRMNKYRVTGHHIVFFIFVVSNVGGCLTPIGDPPLFLGYLKGVPFWWIMARCWPVWAVALAILLAIFFFIDRDNYRRAPRGVRSKLAEQSDEWGVRGLWNLGWLAVILGSVFINRPIFLRELIMAAAAIASFYTTAKDVHNANDFNFHPIKEVAILFVGIFATMIPALDWLQLNAHRFAEPSPGFFFWSTGSLSSFLDNAPTYLSFLSAAIGLFGDGAADPEHLGKLLLDPGFAHCLTAVSVGAVFFGACTYIGNGPNFMVKSIADQQKVNTPGFLGYVMYFTVPVMLPMLLVIWLLFFLRVS